MVCGCLTISMIKTEHFHHPKKCPSSINPLPQLLPSRQLLIYSHYTFAFSWISYNWIIVCSPLCLTFFHLMFLTFIYIVECINTYKYSVFVSVLSSIPWYVCTKFVFPFTNQYLGCFQLLTIINNTSINIHVKVFA